MKKQAKPYEVVSFTIINPYGDVWGPDVYDSAEQAANYLDLFWGGRKKWEGSGYTLAPAVATVAVTGSERIKLP